MDNEAMNSDLEFNLPHNKSSVIKVLGVGGGGSNAVNHMKSLGIKDVDFVICNTDAQALAHSDVENKIQLGASLTEGLGAGANPEVGRNSAIESLDQLKKILENKTKMLFITAGMGGGTGTGAAPIIAKLSKEMDLLTVGVVTMPFTFEGRARMKQAEEGLIELRKHVDSLIIIKNDKLREVYGNLGFKAGFSKADVILANAVKAIAEVITHHYRSNIDLEDAKRVLANSGTAIMGSASADGENRAMRAIVQALDSPLLNDNHINGAKNVLLLIISGSDEHEITFDEIGDINDHIQSEAGGNTNIILGIGEDESLGDKISVTVVATGFDDRAQVQMTTSKNEKKIIPLGTDEEPPKAKPSPESHPIAKTIQSPIDTPIANIETEPPISSPQTDLFAIIEDKKKESIESPQNSPNENTINEPVDNKAEKELLDLEAFSEDLGDNEVVLDIQIHKEELKEEISEPDINEPASETVEAPIPESIEVTKEVPTIEEETTTPLVESVYKKEEDAFEFSISSEDGEEVIEDKADDFIIVNEEPEFRSLPEEPDEEPNVKLDPLNFSIDQVIGHPSNEQEALSEPLQSLDSPLEEKVEDPEKIEHSLNDLLELEQLLGVNKKTRVEKISGSVEPQKTEEIEFAVTIKEPPAEEEEEFSNPVEDRIADAMKQRIADRKNRLKAFTYNFRKQQDELSKPAYERAGIDIQNNGLSEDNTLSRLSVNGEGKNIELGGNSFLHDNVD